MGGWRWEWELWEVAVAVGDKGGVRALIGEGRVWFGLVWFVSEGIGVCEMRRVELYLYVRIECLECI